jgi:TctA family transporter
MTGVWIVAIGALVAAVVAYAQARRTARQMYWQLKFDHGELKAKVDPAAPVAPKPKETFVPLTNLKR